MAELKIFGEKSLKKYVKSRTGETKLGEKIQLVQKIEDLAKSQAEFVIFGIPEDIGVRANHGKAGTSEAWTAFLNSFLNLQHNQFLNAEKILLLGEIDCSPEMRKASNLETSDPNYFVKLGELVEKIDQALSASIKTIFAAGKIPVVIGGGHNNAYGNIKGASEFFGKSINVLNIDAHSDLRLLEHRHSGNAFSYARKNGFLHKYSIFGLQQNYTPQNIYDGMNKSTEIQYVSFEELLISDKPSIFEKSLRFVASEEFGFEMDCDSIANFPSSALSPSGFLFNEVRQFLMKAAKSKNCIYLHLTEAIPSKHFPVGKALSILVTDFLKAKAHE